MVRLFQFTQAATMKNKTPKGQNQRKQIVLSTMKSKDRPMDFSKCIIFHLLFGSIFKALQNSEEYNCRAEALKEVKKLSVKDKRINCTQLANIIALKKAEVEWVVGTESQIIKVILNFKCNFQLLIVQHILGQTNNDNIMTFDRATIMASIIFR